MGEKEVSKERELVIIRMPDWAANYCHLDFLHGIGTKLKSKRNSFAKSPVQDKFQEQDSKQTTEGTVLTLKKRRKDSLSAHKSSKAVKSSINEGLGLATPPTPPPKLPRNFDAVSRLTTDGQALIHHAASTPFADSTISIAVDVSTSTRGLVLSQEALAISTICHQLSSEARDMSNVLPWSGNAHPILRMTESARLKPSFGTHPSILCSNNDHATALKNSRLWFLMTDGMILEEHIRDFAGGIARRGLHGTTCVIILFGYTPHKPVHLNTSVGISVFAVAPNCLFLFHDVESGTLYVLQHKGCFTKNFQDTWSDNPSLDNDTSWTSLPQTTYEQLASLLQVPNPLELDEDDIALADGTIINMRDLYQDRLNAQSVSHIFGNDDSMKTVVLTAATRGRSVEVERWLAKQRTTAQDQLTAPRPDIDGRAFYYSSTLIALMSSQHSISKTSMQKGLRDAHAANWRSFKASILNQLGEVETHNIIVRDSIARIGSTRDVSLSSPSIMSPVSSGYSVESRSPGLRPPPQGHSSSYSSIGQSAVVDPQNYGNEYNPMPLSPLPSRQGMQYRQYAQPTMSFHKPVAGAAAYYKDARSYQPADAAANQEDDPPCIYFPRYRKKVGYCPDQDPLVDCSLCGASTSPVALLLKRPDPNAQTEGLPPRNGQAKLAFPLAMGNFPETDIISTFLCCDPCSYFVDKIGKAPPNEDIVGVMMLISFDDNRSLWISALDTALERRFSEQDLELLLLAILYTTLQDVDPHPEGPNSAIGRALHWAIGQLQRTIQIPSTLSQGLAAPGEKAIKSQFFAVLEDSFRKVSQPKAPILRYPIEGFAILVRAAHNMDNLEQPDIDNAVFQRFLFHLTEQFNALRIAQGPISLVDILGSEAPAHSPLHRITIPFHDGQDNAQNAATPVTVSSLCGGPLLSDEAYATFQSMLISFSVIEESGAGIIGIFAQELLEVPKEVSDSAEIFEHTRTTLDMQALSQSLAGTTLQASS